MEPRAAPASGQPATSVQDMLAQRERAYLAAIVESSDDAIISMSLDGVIQSWNSGAQRIYGYTPTETIGRAFTMLIPKDRRTEEIEILGRLRRGERIHHFETVRLTKSGRLIDVSITVSPVRDASGTIIGASKIARDITGRRQAEQALREQQDRLRIAQEAAHWGIFDFNYQTGENYWSPEIEALYGLRPGQFERTYEGWLARLHPDDRPQAERGMKVALEHGEYSQDFRVVWPDGSLRWLFARAKVFRDERGRPVRMLGVNVDITDRKWAEERIAALSNELRLITDAAPALISYVGTDYRYRLVNRAYERWFGRSREQIRGQHVRDLLGESAWDVVRPYMERALAGEEVSFEHQIEYRTVGPRWVRVTYTPDRDAHGAVCGFAVLVSDISEARRAEEALRENRERLLAALSASGTGTFRWSLRTGTMDWDQPLHGLLGVGKPPREGYTLDDFIGLVHGADRPTVLEHCRRCAADGTDLVVECRVDRPDGTVRWLDIRGKAFVGHAGRPLYVTGACVDITDRKQFEQELDRYRRHLENLVMERTAQLEASQDRLRLSERLAAIGTLGAGLGHDMGNLLMPLRVRLESLEAMDLPPEAKEDLAVIRNSAGYLQKLAGGLRTLAVDPRAAGGREAIELHEWWEETQPVLRNVLPRAVTLECSFPQAPCAVKMSRPALTQTIFNLVQNAGHAMKDQAAGTVSITAERTERMVALRIADTGPGMTEEVRRRCMEPFFTTKPRSLSTGLGLALVYGLVRDAGGDVAVDSWPGKGTTFTLTLPAVEPPKAGPKPMRRAVVRLKNARLQAFVAAELRQLSFEVADPDRIDEAEIVVADSAEGIERPGATLVLIGADERTADAERGILTVPAHPREMREALRAAASRQHPGRRS